MKNIFRTGVYILALFASSGLAQVNSIALNLQNRLQIHSNNKDSVQTSTQNYGQQYHLQLSGYVVSPEIADIALVSFLTSNESSPELFGSGIQNKQLTLGYYDAKINVLRTSRWPLLINLSKKAVDNQQNGQNSALTTPTIRDQVVDEYGFTWRIPSSNYWPDINLGKQVNVQSAGNAVTNRIDNMFLGFNSGSLDSKTRFSVRYNQLFIEEFIQDKTTTDRDLTFSFSTELGEKRRIFFDGSKKNRDNRQITRGVVNLKATPTKSLKHNTQLRFNNVDNPQSSTKVYEVKHISEYAISSGNRLNLTINGMDQSAGAGNANQQKLSGKLDYHYSKRIGALALSGLISQDLAYQEILMNDALINNSRAYIQARRKFGPKLSVNFSEGVLYRYRTGIGHKIDNDYNLSVNVSPSRRVSISTLASGALVYNLENQDVERMGQRIEFKGQIGITNTVFGKLESQLDWNNIFQPKRRKLINKLRLTDAGTIKGVVTSVEIQHQQLRQPTPVAFSLLNISFPEVTNSYNINTSIQARVFDYNFKLRHTYWIQGSTDRNMIDMSINRDIGFNL